MPTRPGSIPKWCKWYPTASWSWTCQGSKCCGHLTISYHDAIAYTRMISHNHPHFSGAKSGVFYQSKVHHFNAINIPLDAQYNSWSCILIFDRTPRILLCHKIPCIGLRTNLKYPTRIGEIDGYVACKPLIGMQIQLSCNNRLVVGNHSCYHLLPIWGFP